MKKIETELKALRKIYETGDENRFKKEFIRIQQLYNTIEEKNIIADYLINCYKGVNKDLIKIEKMIHKEEQNLNQ